jgi:hypothetical protein
LINNAYYLGGIISQLGIVILSLGLYIIKTKDWDITVSQKWEKRLTLTATFLISLGICTQIYILFLS